MDNIGSNHANFGAQALFGAESFKDYKAWERYQSHFLASPPAPSLSHPLPARINLLLGMRVLLRLYAQSVQNVEPFKPIKTMAKTMFRLKMISDGDYLKAPANVGDEPTVVFRYRIPKGQNADALEAYADVQGSYLREDEETGDYFFFSTKFSGDKAELIINTESGKCYPDMSAMRKAASLAKQFGSVVGAGAAAKLFSTPAAEPAVKKTVSSSPSGIGGL